MKRKRLSSKRFKWGLLIALAISVGIGCVAGPAIAQQKVVKWNNGDWKSMDPAFVTGVLESYVVMNIYAALVQWKYGSMEIVPDLAESWQISDGGLTYTFKLRKGVQFHKGFGEVTAEDVKYSYDRILNPATGAYLAKNYKMIKEVKVVDKHTVQLILGEPYAPLLMRLTAFKAGGIVPKAAVEKYGKKFGMNPVGAGPFEWVKGNPRGDMVLKAFDKYYAGKPKLDQIVFPHIVDATTAYVAFEAGDLDLVNVQDPEIFKKYKADPKIELQTRPGLNINYMVMNTRDKPFSDLKVRQAVAHAIDKKALINTVLKGLATELTGPVPTGCDYYTADVKKYPYDPAKAKALLKEAGYPNGFETTLYTFIWGPAVDVVTAIQGMLAEVGIKARIQADEPSANFEKVWTGKTPVAFFRLTRSSEPNAYLQTQLDPESFPQWNFGHYNNPEVNKLMKEGVQTAEPAKREKIYAELQKKIMEDLPNVWLYSDNVSVAYHPYIKGFKLDPLWTKKLYPVSVEK
jgi:peptide/nickel transport system substrate-binding protein